MTDFHETTVRVRYVETDQMGVVYHSNFFVWFEIGRVELFRELGVVYKDMEEKDDCFIVVGECKCRFKRPARYDDLLRVRTRIAEAGSRKITFEYEIVNEVSGELLATGETVHVICDKLGRSKSLPGLYRKLFGIRTSDEVPAPAH
jgi:acyl-CoA thioester hydrolase